MIKKDFKNTLLKRREVVLEIDSSQNPGKEGAKNAIVDKLKANLDLIAIKKISGFFGSDKFMIEAFIYESKEDLEKTEPKKKEKKK
ncbi:hypothetical protein AUJ84_01750 [Candidatus Pacearchaeota archaeon CG1_02_32_132]|nr:MAG: hypothetical protein AUJ84_01750 [Candidatus Pacearchaeota archaeon CG1_02_32_132]